MKNASRFRSIALTLSTLLILLLAADREAGARHGEDTLTLRVNPAITVQGGIFTVVLRTYAPSARSARGRCWSRSAAGRRTKSAFSALPAAAAERPLATLLSAVVYSVRGDSVTQTSFTFNPAGQSTHGQVPVAVGGRQRRGRSDGGAPLPARCLRSARAAARSARSIPRSPR